MHFYAINVCLLQNVLNGYVYVINVHICTVRILKTTYICFTSFGCFSNNFYIASVFIKYDKYYI